LGPKNCTLSIVKGYSNNRIYKVLTLLGDAIKTIGVQYFLTTNEIDLTAENRNYIQAFTELCNQVLWPLRNYCKEFSENSIIIFINDIAIYMEDILELIY